MCILGALKLGALTSEHQGRDEHSRSEVVPFDQSEELAVSITLPTIVRVWIGTRSSGVKRQAV
jgi:hypothetical protein